MEEKGDCFKNVYNYALDYGTPETIVVHGEVNKRDGTAIKHAWLEEGDTVIEPTFLISGHDMRWNKEMYYGRLNAKPEAKYNAMDAIGLAVRARNYGPWTTDEQRGKNLMKEEKKTAKKYLVNEQQFQLISENLMNETQSEFKIGDYIQLLAPIDGEEIPLQTPFKIEHIDANATLRVRVPGKSDLVAVCPDVDQVVKINQNGELNENKTPVTRTEWVNMSNRQFSDLLNPLEQAKGKRYVIKVVKGGYKYYLTDNGIRDQVNGNAARQLTTNIKDAVSSDDYQQIYPLMYAMLDPNGRVQVIELVDRMDSRNNVKMNGMGEKI